MKRWQQSGNALIVFLFTSFIFVMSLELISPPSVAAGDSKVTEKIGIVLGWLDGLVSSAIGNGGAAIGGAAAAETSTRPGPEFSARVDLSLFINSRFVKPSRAALKRGTGVDLTLVDPYMYATSKDESLYKLTTSNEIFLSDVALRYGDLEYFENTSGMTPGQWKAQDFRATIFAPNPLIVIADKRFPFASLTSKQLKDLLLGETTKLKVPNSKTSWDVVPIVMDDAKLIYTLRRDLLDDRQLGEIVVSSSPDEVAGIMARYYKAPSKQNTSGRTSIAILGSWDAVWNNAAMDGLKLVHTDLKVEVPYILITTGPPTPAVKKIADFYKAGGAMFVTPELPRQLLK